MRSSLSPVVVAAVAAGLALTVIACNRSAEASSSTSAAPAPSATPAASSLDLKGMKRVPRAADFAPSHPSVATLGSQVMGQLEREKRTRPTASLPAERVAAAFSDKGVVFEPLRQGLGSPIGAGYCAMSLTKTGVAFTVCEFGDAAAAAAGKARSEQRLSALPGRAVQLVNGETLLMLRGDSDNAALVTERDAMAEAFRGLKG